LRYLAQQLGVEVAEGLTAHLDVLAKAAVLIAAERADAREVVEHEAVIPDVRFADVVPSAELAPAPVDVDQVTERLENRSSLSASTSSVMGTGTDDVLYIGGWLDVNAGPQVLHAPEMDGRYYSVQLTDPTSGANFAYVGTRATGSAAGDFLLCQPGWKGDVPAGMTRIDAPHRSALLIGRVFAADDHDRLAAFELAKQIKLAPLNTGRGLGSANLAN